MALGLRLTIVGCRPTYAHALGLNLTSIDFQKSFLWEPPISEHNAKVIVRFSK